MVTEPRLRQPQFLMVSTKKYKTAWQNVSIILTIVLESETEKN